MSLPPSLQDERVDLLPCPFCGNADVQFYLRADGLLTVSCNDCGGEGPGTNGNEKQAARYWNDRAALSPAQADAEVERLRNALRGLLDAQTSRERAYATMEAQAALSEERPQVSDAPAQAGAASLPLVDERMPGAREIAANSGGYIVVQGEDRHPMAMYWGGKNEAGGSIWTTCRAHAVRFARAADAEAMRPLFGDNEHMPAPTVASYAEIRTQAPTPALKYEEALIFDAGALYVKTSGHGERDGWGRLVFDEDDLDWLDDGEGKPAREALLAPGDLLFLRDQLIRILPLPALTATKPSGQVEREVDELYGLMYAHFLTKFDPVAARRCIRAALSTQVQPVELQQNQGVTGVTPSGPLCPASPGAPDGSPPSGAAANAEQCERCGHQNAVWFAPSPLWNAVMRGGCINGEPLFGDMVCAGCFMVLAEEKGIATRFRVTAEAVNVPLQTVTPSGRVWDEESWLWRGPGDAPAPVQAEGMRENQGVMGDCPSGTVAGRASPRAPDGSRPCGDHQHIAGEQR